MDSKGVSETGCRSGWGYRFFVSALGSPASGCPRLGRHHGRLDRSVEGLNPVSKAYSGLGGVGALIAPRRPGSPRRRPAAARSKADLKRFALGFTAGSGSAYLSWIAGSSRISP